MSMSRVPSLTQLDARENPSPSSERRSRALVSSALGPLSTIQVPRRFTVDEWGGTETTVLQTSRAMNALGHDTRIFTSLALAARREEQVEGVAVRRFPYVYPFFGLSPESVRDLDKKGGNLLSLALLRALLREKSIDLLHAHSGKRLGGVVRTAARLRGIPYVVTLHGGHFEIPTGEMQQMLTPIRGRFEWGRAAGALLGARHVLDDAAAIICVGRDEYEATSRRFPGKRVELLPNGVDSAFFSNGDGDAFRTRHGIPGDRRVVLCVGRIDYQKNQLGLVEAFELLKRREPRAHLVLLGPVTVSDYREKLGNRVEMQALHDRVTIVPALRWDDPMLAGAYHASDVFCLPSLHEPFGMVILEAWSAGLPVVAARVGGIPSFTTHGHDILHVDPECPEDIASALHTVLRNPKLARSLAEHGRARARRDYDWFSISERLVSIYRDVLAGGYETKEQV
jgi:glycosyltransferase involved in cell wall biosynthesis